MSDSDEYSNGILSLSQTDAAVLCAARGGWLVDMDEGRGAPKHSYYMYSKSDITFLNRPSKEQLFEISVV